MNPPSVWAPRRLSQRIWRLGAGAACVLGLGGMATIPALAVTAGLRAAVLAGAFSAGAALLGCLTDALGEARWLVALLAENGRDVTVRVDAEGWLLFVSAAMLPVLGYRPKALVGSPLIRLCHPADAPSPSSPATIR